MSTFLFRAQSTVFHFSCMVKYGTKRIDERNVIHQSNNNIEFYVRVHNVEWLWKIHCCVPSGSSSNIHTENVTK